MVAAATEEPEPPGPEGDLLMHPLGADETEAPACWLRLGLRNAATGLQPFPHPAFPIRPRCGRRCE